MLGEQIKRLRMQRKMSQKDLGLVFNVIKQTVSSWETGNSKPSHAVLEMMANYFGVTVDQMYGRGEALSPIEEEWPDVIQVLRESGPTTTPEERKRIARIIRAALAKGE